MHDKPVDAYYDFNICKKNIGIKVAYYRKQRNMSQQELADALDVEQQHVSSIENGRLGLSIKRLLRISEALRIKPYLLLYHDDILSTNEVEPKQVPFICDHCPAQVDYAMRTQDR